MDSGFREVQSENTAGMSVSSEKGHFRATTSRQISTQTLAMDLRSMRKIVFRRKIFRHAL